MSVLTTSERAAGRSEAAPAARADFAKLALPQPLPAWVPAFAGMSGRGALRAVIEVHDVKDRRGR